MILPHGFEREICDYQALHDYIYWCWYVESTMAQFPQSRAQDRLNHYLVSDETASSNISSLTVMLTVVYLAFCDRTVKLQYSILIIDPM